jgi:hypothetical protein
MEKAIFYVRVSSDQQTQNAEITENKDSKNHTSLQQGHENKQAYEPLGLEGQERQCRAYCERMGLTLVNKNL